jgi:hypothetical protein
MATKLITKSMLLDLEQMSQENSAFPDRLNALLDALSIPPQGQGRSTWLVEAAGIQPVAAGKWFTGTKPRRSNLTTLASYIETNYPVNVTKDELLDFLTGKLVKLDVNAELAKSGLSPPEQGFIQTIVARAMKERDLDPLDQANLLLWTKVVIRVARYYAVKQSKGNTPEEEAVLASASAFLDLAILDAI